MPLPHNDRDGLVVCCRFINGDPPWEEDSVGRLDIVIWERFLGLFEYKHQGIWGLLPAWCRQAPIDVDMPEEDFRFDAAPEISLDVEEETDGSN